MNSLVLLTGLFALAAFAAGAWAIVERGRAARAEERLRLLEANAETLKAQAAQSAEQVAQTLVQRATDVVEHADNSPDRFGGRFCHPGVLHRPNEWFREG